MTEQDAKPRIALFGLGLIGSGMAKMLLEAGYGLTIYNRTQSKIEPFVAMGAKSAATPLEAATGAGVLICIVAEDEASRGIWLGDDGALAGAAPGSVLIDASTLSVDWVRELGRLAREKGCSLLDTPVTGSRVQAASGQLTFIVGGDAETLERVRPLLEVMGKRILYLGPQGSGAMMKLINNFLCGVHAASLAEAIAMIENSGLDPEGARAMLESGAPASPLVKIVYDRMTKRDYTPNFHLRLMLKDLTYACREGEKLGLELETGKGALSRFVSARDGGHAYDDFASVVEQFRE